MNLGRFDESIVNFKAALLFDPEDAEERHYLEVAEYRKTVNSPGSEILLNPDDMQAHLNRGEALVGLEQYAEPLADFDAVLELDPEAEEATMARAGALVGLERYEEALAAYDAALELDPDLSEIAVLRSELQSQLALLPDASVNFVSNLRGGSGTNYPVVGEQLEGDLVKTFVQTADEQWIKLVQGEWIHASLLNDVSLDRAITQQIPTVPGEATTA